MVCICLEMLNKSRATYPKALLYDNLLQYYNRENVDSDVEQQKQHQQNEKQSNE